MISPPKHLDLQTTTLLITLFEGIEKDKNEKVNQNTKTILGLLRSIQEERLVEVATAK